MEILKVPDKAMEYLLMNKDTPLLVFSCIHNVFDETECREENWLSELRPFGYVELTLFLERRKAPKHRANIQALLEHYGCEDLEGFLQVTHAASLNDTLWVKPETSPLQWADVSLYQNEFDEVVSRTAFDGTASSQTFSSTSPEFGTDGSYAKCWVREDDGIYLYKTGSPLFEIEPFSEYFAAQVAELLCPAYVDYDLDSYHGKLISKCRLFTSEKIGFAPASRIFPRPVPLPKLLDYFESIGAGDAFRRMCVLDALIFNPDRHYGNFGVLFDNDTYKVLGMAPVFDHNKSLFPEVDDDKFNDLSWYIAHCKPRLGTDHITTAREMLTPEIQEDIMKIRGKLEFHQSPHYKMNAYRLAGLQKAIRNQINNLLYY